MPLSERWEIVWETTGNYHVSDRGRIRNANTGHVLKPMPNWKGYLEVWLPAVPRRKKFRIHRLVASAFLRQPRKDEQVNHKDFDKRNNSVENLEWCSMQENIDHYFESVKERESSK